MFLPSRALLILSRELARFFVGVAPLIVFEPDVVVPEVVPEMRFLHRRRWIVFDNKDFAAQGTSSAYKRANVAWRRLTTSNFVNCAFNFFPKFREGFFI